MLSAKIDKQMKIRTQKAAHYKKNQTLQEKSNRSIKLMKKEMTQYLPTEEQGIHSHPSSVQFIKCTS